VRTHAHTQDHKPGASAASLWGGILIGKLKQIKTKTRRKLKEIWDYFPSFFGAKDVTFSRILCKMQSFRTII
jgi:hypothetical protein